MTASNHEKIEKQIEDKEGKHEKFLKHNTPKEREFGKSTKKCRKCGRTGGHISKYGLHLCRQCFRDNAEKLGFKQYN